MHNSNKDKSVGAHMTAHPYTIGSDQTLEHAKHLMYSKGIRHLPVLEGGRLSGILSDRDLKLAFAVDGARAKECKVIDACSTETYSVDKSENIKVAVAEMARRSIGCCLVTDGGSIVGIFTAIDACRLLSELL